MAKNRYFRTASISLFTGVVLVGLTLLSSPENARRFYFLSIGQDAPPLVSPTVAIASKKQILLSQSNSDETITQITKKQSNSIQDISINEPGLLPESGDTPLELTEVGELNKNDSHTQPVRLEESQLLKPEEEMIVKIDTTQLDERIVHLDEQINRLQDVELKQREILVRSEKLLEEVTVNTVEDEFPEEEETLETTEPVDSSHNNEGPVLGVNLEKEANTEEDYFEEEPVQNELDQNESDKDVVSENEETTEPVLIAERDDTDSTKIYLRFENAEIRKVFQLLAEVSQSVIFVTPELAGELTSEYRVRDLEEALSMILPVMGYSFEREDNRLYIMPVATLKKVHGNLELKKSVREKMINVKEEQIQAQGKMRRMNPGLQPPDENELISLIEHQETGDHKMGEADIDELTQNLFSGESVLQDDFEVDSNQVPKLTQPKSAVVQSSYNQFGVKAAHTPRLFEQKQIAKPIVSIPSQNKISSIPTVQNRNQRLQYPVQRRNQLRPVSMPVISVKAF